MGSFLFSLEISFAYFSSLLLSDVALSLFLHTAQRQFNPPSKGMTPRRWHRLFFFFFPFFFPPFFLRIHSGIKGRSQIKTDETQNRLLLIPKTRRTPNKLDPSISRGGGMTTSAEKKRKEKKKHFFLFLLFVRRRLPTALLFPSFPHQRRFWISNGSADSIRPKRNTIMLANRDAEMRRIKSLRRSKRLARVEVGFIFFLMIYDPWKPPPFCPWINQTDMTRWRYVRINGPKTFSLLGWQRERDDS